MGGEPGDLALLLMKLQTNRTITTMMMTGTDTPMLIEMLDDELDEVGAA